MKYLTLIFVLFLSCKSPQLKDEKIVTKKELTPPFNNQGEQEDYWTQELFKKEYKKKFYPKFNGEIKKDKDKIYFGEKQFIDVSNLTSDLQLIFEEGLFYPEILEAESLIIGNLVELDFLSNTPKIKRFRFWLSYKNRSNPQVIIFELFNSTANKDTNWKSFIKNAKLTFVKKGWIII